MLPVWLDVIERRITENGGRFAAGDKITIADFGLGMILNNMMLNEANMNYHESLPFVKDRVVLASYSKLFKETLGDFFTNRAPRPF